MRTLTNNMPEGFRHADDLLTEHEEIALTRTFAELPFQPFDFHGYFANRHIVSYGFRYDYGARALRESTALPEFLLPLRFKAAEFARVPAESLQQALVTQYATGAGIGWHRDKSMFDDVVAFSFLAPCVLRFRRNTGGKWDRRKCTLAPRSVYVLSGPARWEWYHSIPAVRELRYSVTFRNFVSDRR